MTTTKALFQLLYLVILSECITLDATRIISNTSNFSAGCVETERTTLLKFKASLKDSLGRLSSWVDEDCCQWEGVGCDNRTGNVVKLDLNSQDVCSWGSLSETATNNLSCLGGELNPSLLDLKYLNYLDLSLNNFEGIVIPEFMGSFKHLSYLNLFSASFCGKVPPHLGNLSNLHYLSLDSHQCYFLDKESWVPDLNWLSGLSSLKYLKLRKIDLSLTKSDWLQPIKMLSSLSELHLPKCKLRHLPQTPPFVNLTSLLVLNLHGNKFNSPIPQWVLNMSTLTDIDLSSWELYGSFSEVAWGESLADNKFEDKESWVSDLNWLSGLSSLKYLNLGYVNLSLAKSDWLQPINMLPSLSELHLPDCKLYYLPQTFPFVNLTSLLVLDLQSNKFSSSIPQWVLNISTLTDIDLSYCELYGPFSEVARGDLCNLRTVSLASNRFEGEINNFLDSLSRCSNKSLEELDLSRNKLSGKLPNSLGDLQNLKSLGLSYNSFSGSIPTFIGMMSSLEALGLSDNSWEGDFSEIHFLKLKNLSDFSISSSNPSFTFHVRDDWIPSFSLLCRIRIENCRVGPKFPAWLQTQKYLDTIILQNVSISDTIPDWLWTFSSYGLRGLYLSGNNLTGSIPTSISKLQNLGWLDLSSNHLSGNIPRHWEEMNKLKGIDLSNNNLSGDIPSSICSMPSLIWLKLNNNNLSGELSPTLQNCIGLEALDLGENKFFGNLPKWMGERLSSLKELRLRENKFSGIIPEQLCSLSYLHVLDLAQNNLLGFIPPCLGNMTGFQGLSHSEALFNSMELVMKGRKLVYDRTLPLVKLFDLSDNNLRGEIPREITHLSTLGTLNLSRNQLTGKIPDEIGALQLLETLDLSSNHLSGPIPPSMTSITSLSYLNLSYNNLSGQIPSTNQFYTWIDPSIYVGNLLCGPPLPTSCSKSNNSNNTKEDRDDDDEDEDEDRSYKLGLFVSVALGFIMGFWLVCGSLVIKKSWRDAYFRFLNKTEFMCSS